MTSKQHQPERDQRQPVTPSSQRVAIQHLIARWKSPLVQLGLIIRSWEKYSTPLARTMIDDDYSKQRRLVEFKDGCRYGKFGKTKAYELIAQRADQGL